MIKKIFLTLVLCCIMISCGKKGDPEYKDPGQKARIQSTLIDKV
tara:strand:+ start:268 stop:399 length:132 start_codon:yes stop_codon:yes gene_type:complete